MYQIIASPQAQKELKTIKKLYRDVLVQAVQELKDDPFVGKPLVEEYSGRYTYKIGVYRIIYIINKNDQTVFILTAGHRSTVYK